jgi:multidrug efflux pump subunit AcrA (membrane-fusion protein)
VWIQTQVFEDDLELVRVGQTARLRVVATGVETQGTVAFVDPVIDRRTRTARVRIEVENPEIAATGSHALRVGQRMEIRIEARLDEQGHLATAGTEPGVEPLVVPRSAVLRTGRRTVGYVLFAERDGGERDYAIDPNRLPRRVHYEMVELRVGPMGQRPGSDGEEFQVVVGLVTPKPHVDAATGAQHAVLGLDALREGIVIVTKGNLLLDSQAQLSGKPSLLFPDGNRGPAADPHLGH